jgi:FdhD protein
MKKFTKFTKIVDCYTFTDNLWDKESFVLPKEEEVNIYINEKYFLSILATPSKLDYLAIGILFSEGLTKAYEDIESIEIDSNKNEIHVSLNNKNFSIPEKKIFTSGFGKGVIFRTNSRKVVSDIYIDPINIFPLIEEFYDKMEMYKFGGGIHASALADNNKIVLIAEDIGRHNTVDKIIGEALVKNIPTKDKILISTGRISTEMILKASNMNIPIVITLKIPTGNAIKIADEYGITIIGKIRPNGMIVFTYPERVGYKI